MAGYIAPEFSQTTLANGDIPQIGYVTVPLSNSFAVGATVSLKNGATVGTFQVADVQPGLVGLRSVYPGTPSLNRVNFGLTSVNQYPSGSIITQTPQLIYAPPTAGSRTSNPNQTQTNFQLLKGTPTAGQIGYGVLFADTGQQISNSRASVKYTVPIYDSKNLLVDPETLTAASWTAVRATMTLDNVVAKPSAAAVGTSVYQFADNAVSGSHRINSKNIYITGADGSYTWSVYAKAGTSNYLNLAFGRQPPGCAVFDLVNGVVLFSFGSPTTTITPADNGWWRISITGSETVPPDQVYFIANANGTNTFTPSYVGTGQYVYVCAAKAERNSAPTSYLFTGGHNNRSILSLGNNTVAVDSRGMLSEDAHTNIIPDGNSLNMGWANTASGTANTITTSAITAPDGVSSATQINFNTAFTGGNFSFWQASNAGVYPGNGTYTLSIWLMAGTLNSIPIVIRATGGGATGINAINCSLNSQWQRFVLTFTAGGTATGIQARIGCDTSFPAFTFGVGTIYAWGAMVTPGSYAYSYAPTTINATASVAADALTTPSAGFPVEAGTILFNFIPEWDTHPNSAAAFFDTGPNGTTLTINNTTGQIDFKTDGSSSLTTTPSWVAGQKYRLKLVWGKGNKYIYRDSTLLASITNGSATMPTANATNTKLGGTGAIDGWLSNFLITS